MPRILIADDDPHVRAVIRLTLRHAGHETFEAADGDAALRAYTEYTPDLVLCDLRMPGKDGLETIRELRRGFPGVRIVR